MNTIGKILALVGGQQNMRQPEAHVQQSQHCKTIMVTSKIQKGYDVTDLYNGQQDVARMNNPPC